MVQLRQVCTVYNCHPLPYCVYASLIYYQTLTVCVNYYYKWLLYYDYMIIIIIIPIMNYYYTAIYQCYIYMYTHIHIYVYIFLINIRDYC